MIIAVDAKTGMELASVVIPAGIDNLHYDSKRNRLYASCGDGAVAVVEKKGDEYALIAKVETVKAAFAHHLRRAQRELAASPPAVSEPAPTQPGGGKMRGFLLSVFSVFASRAALAQPPAAREENDPEARRTA
jgi:hypothetical protein